MQRSFLALFVLLACGPKSPGSDDVGDDTSASGPAADDGSTSEPAATTAASATSLPPAATTTTAGGTEVDLDTTSPPPGSSSGGDDPTFDSGTFLIPYDGGPHPDLCDIWAQDCPDGEKCTPYADDGGSTWNSVTCRPVAPDPAQVGEPCTAEDGLSGVDTCDLGLFCWDLDVNLEGTCTALCTGSPEAPECAPPNTFCAISGDGVLSLCLDNCDPLAPACDADEVCVQIWSDEFGCVLDASGDAGKVHDPCEYLNACDLGLLCVPSETAAVECDADLATGCCQPYCDLDEPNPCTGVGQTCVPFYENGDGPPEHQDLGVCALP